MIETLKKRTLKLTVEYGCYPLWEQTENGSDNIDPLRLPISLHLKKLLINWKQKFDSTFNQDDPYQSGFHTLEAKSAFRAEGESLQSKLKMELGDSYIINFYLPW